MSRLTKDQLAEFESGLDAMIPWAATYGHLMGFQRVVGLGFRALRDLRESSMTATEREMAANPSERTRFTKIEPVEQEAKDLVPDETPAMVFKTDGEVCRECDYQMGDLFEGAMQGTTDRWVTPIVLNRIDDTTAEWIEVGPGGPRMTTRDDNFRRWEMTLIGRWDGEKLAPIDGLTPAQVGMVASTIEILKTHGNPNCIEQPVEPTTNGEVE